MDYSKIGSHLKIERERKGLSYDQIFEITRIQPAILKGIEEGKAEVSLVFLKGFIKSYARSLGLEPEELFKEAEAKGQKNKSEKRPSGGRPVGKGNKIKIQKIELMWAVLAGFIALSVILVLSFSGKNPEDKGSGGESFLKEPVENKVEGRKLLKHRGKGRNGELTKGQGKEFAEERKKKLKEEKEGGAVGKADLSSEANPPSLFNQVKESVFKEEILIQSSEPLKIYFKLDRQATVTRILKPSVWFVIKAKKSIYLRFDEKRGDIQIFYNGDQVRIGRGSFFERVFQQ